MFISQLYQKFHIFIHLDKFQDSQKIFDVLSKIYYSNFQIYILTTNRKLTFSHPFVKIIKLTYNFQRYILEYVKNISYHENIVIFENIDKYLNENTLLELNTIFVKEKPKLIVKYEADNSLFLWTCKSGIINELLYEINKDEYKDIDLLTYCSNFVKENNIKLLGNYTLIQSDIIKKFSEKYHILFATFKRNENLTSVFDMLSKQSIKNIHIHLLDNNEELGLQNEIDEIIKKYDFLQITLYRFHKNLHCFGRITVIKKIMETCVLDYIIIFDDDQLYEKKWIENMILQKQPLSTLSWYGKIFTSCDYWKSSVWYTEIEKKRRPEIKEWSYFGPGGSIIDINLFLFEELYDYEKYSHDIKFIDDIWMSFIFKRYLNISFHRIITHPQECIEWKNKKKMTWFGLKKEKNNLFQYLSNEFDWDVTKNNIVINKINRLFDRIYLLYNDDDNIDELINKSNKWNICCYFQKIIENSHILTRNKIIENNNNTTLLFLDSKMLFDNFFLYKIHKTVDNVRNSNSNVLYLDEFK